ncbi:MAG: hypothetical protein DRQ59_14335 [Gammaproteobacteria bacterium]|nr:MAG: hypothetical protein DRQ59_14335 [Gammaproteobacteria bacterium]
MDFSPFILCTAGTRPPAPRKIGTGEGLGDRMRTAAFAELQAIAAFTWAAGKFDDAPAGLRDDWLRQVPEEQKHYDLIVARMAELGFRLDERPVSGGLWDALSTCTSAREFCLRIADAEERGRRAGLRLAGYLAGKDPATAAVFREIADDEVSHVALADTYYGWTPAAD